MVPGRQWRQAVFEVGGAGVAPVRLLAADVVGEAVGAAACASGSRRGAEAFAVEGRGV